MLLPEVGFPGGDRMLAAEQCGAPCEDFAIFEIIIADDREFDHSLFGEGRKILAVGFDGAAAIALLIFKENGGRRVEMLFFVPADGEVLAEALFAFLKGCGAVKAAEFFVADHRINGSLIIRLIPQHEGIHCQRFFCSTRCNDRK